MQRIAIIYNPFSEASISHSALLAAWLRERGIDIWRGISQECRECPQILEDADLMIAMGGDGTVLRAARLAFPSGLPVLPVALGHLSFMAEIGPAELYEGIETLLNGGGWHDERALIDATLWREGEHIADFVALNEVVISRSEISRVINVEVAIDGSLLTTYLADGVIVATATGSTAYALAAGGPIIDPRSRALALVPVAAHLTNVPSMVLHEGAVVTITMRSRNNASIAIDGRGNLPLLEGDEVMVRRSAKVCTFLRLRHSSQFYTQLAAKLKR
ncbi:ATP-NAD/AcoX kinase [Oscillochloris trichoides DG-6]|uniref:NAD kinase n=1 Tax=Oscillochloris trichoides DG-6 TaxID=765420 RepID=E1IHQ2_9CHLR|nr:NAD(+)/NADH kinase [Oscillochloris trichoides]EFO79272.1 ATP-NAD/AcoX kinase [Oscillochloris trichoides DG-6]